ncbi:MAG TPA: hypothetical protein VK828_18185 [Terriglobales bacterium]|jgi:hypothetical protein|nr:hypothetical protein [Terriglobales bacterium]
MLTRVCLSFALLMAIPAWSQVDTNNNAPASPVTDNAPMLTPPTVSGQSYPTAPASEARSNYLRYGLTFSTAYSDNATQTSSGSISEASYSLWPTIALDETTSTLHSVLSYSPGFTFYQKTSGLDAADQSVAIDEHYRMSPHVTFSGGDSFQKSSSVFNQPDLASGGGVSGGAQGPNLSVVAPIAEVLTNTGNVGVTYQFAANGMVGGNGTFTNLHYPNPAQVPGLSDSSTQGASAFSSLRISKMHYVGVNYQYQRLVSNPTEGLNETQTHAVFFFYTLYASTTFSVSFFGGPQHSDTVQPPLPPLNIQLPAARAWTPAAGGSLSWQGQRNSVAVSYRHIISGGGGLFGAVHLDSASVSMQQQMVRSLSGSLAASYAQNNLLGSPLFGGASSGHTISGTVSLQKQFGEHFSVQAGYTRLHQSYGGVAVLSTNPDTNREFVSLSYQFSRPLGR